MFSLYNSAGPERRDEEEALVLTTIWSVLFSHMEDTTQFDSLLCRNTPISPMLVCYTRRKVPQDYIAAVLSQRIYKILNYEDLNLEIDPQVVYIQLVQSVEETTGTVHHPFARNVTPELAAENENVQAIIGPRLKMLDEIVDSVLLTIVEQLDSVPFGIRWICKQIRTLVQQRFPDASEGSISSVIGGLFFVRLICPVLQTPQDYLPISGVLAKHPRRSLTLVSLILQQYGNMPLSVEQQSYMDALAPNIEKNRSRVNRFLNDLCEVGEFDDSVIEDKASSNSSFNVHVSLNNLFHVHAMALKYREAFVSFYLVNLSF
ncbi:Rho GTPase activation protein [Sparassis latifolia]